MYDIEEVERKVAGRIMLCQLAAIDFHPCLHGDGGLPKHRAQGMSTATIEANVAQHLCVCVLASRKGCYC